MTLSDLLLTPANIQTLQNQFGLSRDQTVEAVGALLPAFSAGLKRNVATGQQAASFVEALATGRHGRYAETPETATTKKGRQEGDDILSHLFGRKKVSREVAARASATTGIGADLLQRMLPVIASMVMGALFKGATGGQSGGGLGKALGGAAGGGLLGTLIEGLANGALGGGRQSTQAGGGPLGDLLGQVLQGGLGGLGGASGRAVPQSGQGGSLDGGLGDLLGQILGGGGAGGAREPRQPRADTPMPPRSPREPRAPRGTGSGGLQDIFGDMLEPGRAANPRARTGSVIDELLGN